MQRLESEERRVQGMAQSRAGLEVMTFMLVLTFSNFIAKSESYFVTFVDFLEGFWRF